MQSGRRTAIGRRNYAMLMILARLGLRAPEVIAIQLDDIDWRAGTILIRGQGQTARPHAAARGTPARPSSITSRMVAVDRRAPCSSLTRCRIGRSLMRRS